MPVIHVCHGVEDAQSEIPRLIRGEHLIPSSGLGSNVDTTNQGRLAKAVLVGGKFSPEDIEAVRQSEEARRIPWLRADLSNVPPEGWPPAPEHAAERMIACLKAHGITEDSDGIGQEDIWMW